MSTPKILSVDDSRMVHTLIGRGFANYNVNMVFASNGQEGLEVAAKEKPDVILLDVTMPVMDGVECLGKLKADPALKDIPVIMLTAEAGKENVLKIAKMGVRDYIVKPFTEAGIIERVSRLITLTPKGAAAPAPAAAAAGPATKKHKIVTDAVKVLVVDEFPAIIENVAKALAPRGWKVVGSPSPDDAKAHVASSVAVDETPDIILISLAYPNKAALAFYQTVRSNPVLKGVPILGLCLKTATFEMNDAKEIGFAGNITKPLDLAELPDRLVNAMDMDITPVFYSQEGSAQAVRLQQDISETGSLTLSRQSRKKLADLVNSGCNQLIVDMTGVAKIEVPLLRALTTIINEAKTLEVEWRIVGDANLLSTLPTIVSTNLKVSSLKDIPNPFTGINTIEVYATKAAASASF